MRPNAGGRAGATRGRGGAPPGAGRGAGPQPGEGGVRVEVKRFRRRRPKPASVRWGSCRSEMWSFREDARGGERRSREPKTKVATPGAGPGRKGGPCVGGIYRCS